MHACVRACVFFAMACAIDTHAPTHVSISQNSDYERLKARAELQYLNGISLFVFYFISHLFIFLLIFSGVSEWYLPQRVLSHTCMCVFLSCVYSWVVCRDAHVLGVHQCAICTCMFACVLVSSLARSLALALSLSLSRSRSLALALSRGQ